VGLRSDRKKKKKKKKKEEGRTSCSLKAIRYLLKWMNITMGRTCSWNDGH